MAAAVQDILPTMRFALPLLLVVAACDTDDGTTPAATDAAIPDALAPIPDAAPVADAPVDPCWLAGQQLKVTEVICTGGASDSVVLTDPFVTGSTTVFRFAERNGGGCAITMVRESADCHETRAFEVVPVPGDRGDFTSQGISACQPAACRFDTDDDACIVGAEATTGKAMLAVVLDTDIVVLTVESPVSPCAAFGHGTTDYYLRQSP